MYRMIEYRIYYSHFCSILQLMPLEKLLDFFLELLGLGGRAISANTFALLVDKEFGKVPIVKVRMSALTDMTLYIRENKKEDVPLDGSSPGKTTDVLSLLRLQPRKDLIHVLPVHFRLLHKWESDTMVELQ